MTTTHNIIQHDAHVQTALQAACALGREVYLNELRQFRINVLFGWPSQKPQPKVQNNLHLNGGGLEQLKRDAVALALKECGGDKSKAAKKLKVNRSTIYKHVAALFLCVSISCYAQRGTGTTLAPIAPSPAVTMFAPALAVVAPPTPKTNLFYNIGLTWDIDANPLITGYRIRYGTNTVALTNSLTTTTTFCTISNLAFKPTWYFQAATLWGTNISEWSYTVQVQPPIESGFVLSAVFPLYTSTNGVNWITNKVVTLVQTNPPGNTFFRSHFRQLDYQWTNNQIRLKPF